MRNIFMTITFLFLAACSSTGPANMTEDECRVTSDCPYGTYCDSFTGQCGWDCRNDELCEPGMTCDVRFGRCFREEAPPPTPDASPVLEVTAGSLEDLTVLGGTAGAELVRVALTNRSDRVLVIDSFDLEIDPLDGFNLLNVFGEVEVRDEWNRGILGMGPIDLSGATIDTITTLTGFNIQPGQTITLAIRADFQSGANSEFDVILGTEDRLIATVSYADSGEQVWADRIINPDALVRHVNVRPETAAPAPSGRVEITTTGSGGYITLLHGNAFDAFTIRVVNGTGGAVTLGDPTVHFFMYPASGLLCDTAGACTMGDIRITDERDGSMLPIEPGSCGGGAYGESCYFHGITLASGESTVLTMGGSAGSRPGFLMLTMGEGALDATGIRMSGHLFSAILDASGVTLPDEEVVGNDTALFTTLEVR